MVIAQHERDARNQGQGGTLKLGVATSDGNEGICVMTSGTAYHLAAFFVRLLGHGTCVHNVDVGLVVDVDALKAQLTESAAYVGRLAKVEFAPQRVVRRSLVLQHGLVLGGFYYTPPLNV